MSNQRRVEIVEQRIYDNPQSPATSPYDVALPVTVTDAVIDPTTGQTLTQTLSSISGGHGGSHIYPGFNLAELHSAEIAASPHNGNVWSWIQDRIQAGNYSGINVGDWIQFETTGTNVQTIIAEVAGIDTYRRAGSPEIGRHIDFISRDLWPVTRQWNRVDYNNGLSTQSAPWLVSDLYAWLNGLQMDVPNGTDADPDTVSVDYTTGSATPGLWHSLPEQLRAAIVQKNIGFPTRFSSGILLTDCNHWNWHDIGGLWIPSEAEIYGRAIFSTPSAGTVGFVQYPIFANNAFKRVKGFGNGGARAIWWLCVPRSGVSTQVVAVTHSGIAHITRTTATHCVPVCFRIA